MTAVEITVPATVACAGGQLRFEEDGRVALIGPEGRETSVSVPEHKLSNFIELWCGPGWACFVGSKSRSLWCVWPASGTLACVGELERLDLRGRYDPGGLHRVEFHELPGGDLLVVYEFGLARLTAAGRLCWQQVHEQLTAHLDGVEAGVAWFQGEDERFGFRVDNGHRVV